MDSDANKVAAAVKARGAERFSTIESLSYDTGLDLASLRAAVRAARAAGLIKLSHSAALGATYHA
jgi:hypothetical protein